MKKIKYYNQKGLSLIEILISFAVMAIGAFAVIGLFPSILSLNESSWQGYQAALVAQDKMEELMATNNYISTSYNYDNSQVPSGGYLRWKATSSAVGVQNIIVEVKWVDGGRTKEYCLIGAISP